MKHRSMKRKSVRQQFFLCILSASLVFVLVLSALNLLFYNRYQELRKHSYLRKVYNEIYKTYNNDILSLDSMLESIETNYNIRISITDNYGQYIYDTLYSRERESRFSLHNNTDSDGNAIIFYDGNELARRGYTFSTITGQDNEPAFLALIGTLDKTATLILRIPYATLQQEHSFNFVFLMISAFVSLIVCLLFGSALSGRFTKPLTEMTEVANSVAQLNFSKKFTGTTATGEIAQLGQSINQMSDYLDHAITDLKEMNDRLEAEIRQKQTIDDMRKEFIINISHELKTPIALIQGYAEGLRIGINESEEDKNYYCDIIIDEAHRMNRLVLQLLNLSKIELGNTIPIYSDVDLYELTESVVSKTRVMWQEKSLHLDLSGIGDEVVRADYDLLEQAVTNYMTNAIDHTPEGGTITLSSGADQNHYLFRVRNQGSQLAPEEMEKIWDKFYKLDKARTRVSGGGSGIGLSIVRAIMTAHHGGCGVQNVDDGVEFYLSLPKHPSESPSNEESKEEFT